MLLWKYRLLQVGRAAEAIDDEEDAEADAADGA